MKFRATNEQLCQLLANIYNASKAIGLGGLRVKDNVAKPEDVPGLLSTANDYVDYQMRMFSNGWLSLDYWHGRCVKTDINHIEGDLYRLRDVEPNPAYQSWATTYPTLEALLESVDGIKYGADSEDV